MTTQNPNRNMMDITCVVMTMNSEREHLIFHTTDGTITVALRPINKRRTGVHIYAPRKVAVRREANRAEVTNETVV
jgi:hypothetical protein